MTFIDLIDRYGIPAAILVITVLVLLPAVRDKLIPAWIQLLTADSEFRRRIEIERLESAKRTDKAIEALAQAMIQVATQQTTILANQAAIQEREHDIIEILNTAMNRMTDAVARREGYERGRKEHQKGDTGPLDEGKAGAA